MKRRVKLTPLPPPEKNTLNKSSLISVNGSSQTKRVFLSNQKREIQPILINLHPNEYSQELHFYPFVVKLDRCCGSYNTLNVL